MGLFEVCFPKIDTSGDSDYSVKFTVQENKRPIKLNIKMEMKTSGDTDAGVTARRTVYLINYKIIFKFSKEYIWPWGMCRIELF